jgi:hypothetical protein
VVVHRPERMPRRVAGPGPRACRKRAFAELKTLLYDWVIILRSCPITVNVSAYAAIAHDLELQRKVGIPRVDRQAGLLREWMQWQCSRGTCSGREERALDSHSLQRRCNPTSTPNVPETDAMLHRARVCNSHGIGQASDANRIDLLLR